THERHGPRALFPRLRSALVRSRPPPRGRGHGDVGLLWQVIWDQWHRPLTRFRHPEALAKRAIASRLLPTCALWCRSRVNPRSVGASPGRALTHSRHPEVLAKRASKGDGPGRAAILRDARFAGSSG